MYECFNKNCPVYIDLETGRFYDSFQLRDALIGELYISIKDGLIPYISLVETNRKNMTKRKILKKFDDTIKKNNNDSNIENDNK